MIGAVLYDLLATAALAIWSPVLLYRSITRKKYRKGLRQRLGGLRPGVVEHLGGRRFLWVHACSVGEVRAGKPIVEHLRTLFPEHRILISTVTDTGQQTAIDLGLGDATIYLPIDLHHIWSRMLKRLRPEAVIILETEIWPALIGSLHRRGIPVLIVNGRISDRAFGRYRATRVFFRRVLAHVSLIGAQSERDAERFRGIGAPADRVAVLGNAKFDAVPGAIPASEQEQFRRELGLSGGDGEVVWIAGSTFAGEERLCGEIALRLRQRHPGLRLIVVPRHPERFDEAERDLLAAGATVARRSTGRTPGPDDVILIDRMGELSRLYAIADIAFIGKSLLAEGGQNPLEAASAGCAVVYGPKMQNFREAADLLGNKQAALTVVNPEALESAISSLAGDPSRRAAMGVQAREAVASCRGVARRIAEAAARVIHESPGT